MAIKTTNLYARQDYKLKLKEIERCRKLITKSGKENR